MYMHICVIVCVFGLLNIYLSISVFRNWQEVQTYDKHSTLSSKTANSILKPGPEVCHAVRLEELAAEETLSAEPRLLLRP